MKFAIATAAAAFTLVSMPASAATITAQNGFGAIGPSFSSCKSVSKSSAFVTGALVSGGDWVDGCVGYYGVDVDTVAKTITLTGLQVGNYETAFLDISDISGVSILGLNVVSASGLFDPLAYGGSFASDVPTPLLSFTSNSLRIEFSSIGSPSGQFAFSGSQGQAIFSYAAGAVPEPTTWAMMLAGFGAVGFAMRRRRSVAVSFA